MERRWEYYTAPGGRDAVIKEFRRLEVWEVARVEEVMLRVKTGEGLRPGDVKPLGRDLYELRVNCGNRSFRLIFAYTERGAVLLAVHLFVKKTRKTPQPALELAEQRLKDWRSRR